MAGYLSSVHIIYLFPSLSGQNCYLPDQKFKKHMTCILHTNRPFWFQPRQPFWAPLGHHLHLPCRCQRMVSIQQHRRNGAYEAGDITGWSAVEVFSKRVKDFVPGWAITNGRRTLCVYILDDRVHKKHLVAG